MQPSNQDYSQSPYNDNQKSYSAYPETHQSLQGIVNYQGVVTGLSGWNDAPNLNDKSSNQIILETQNPSKLILETLSNILNSLKTVNIPGKIFADTEKRCLILFEKLEKQELDSTVLGLLIHLSNAVNVQDNSKAGQISMELMQKGTPGDSKWIVGVKRLVELYSKL